jgi:tRNA threonylcarbamoyladenosine biosynthesis protein TsaB
LKLLLAIDTSAGTSVAVLSDKILAMAQFDDPFGHAENVGTAIADALSQAEVGASDITAVAIGRGPAPYTGLRVGMAAGLAFAQARGVPTYGVMVLDAVAYSMSVPKLLLHADAKRREVFVARYESGIRTFGPEVMQPDELDRFEDFEKHQAICDASMVGLFVLDQLAKGIDLSDLSAIYLRSPDVSPSPGKKVSG